jgi:drug/metabolite transporter (DMT)-like permease
VSDTFFARHKGEILTTAGATFFAFNGVIAKLVLAGGLSAWRLTQIRCIGAFLILGTIVFFTARQSLRISRREIPALLLYGAVGYAAVQVFYFLSIALLHVSIALIIEFTAPIWIVLWICYVRKAEVPRLMWGAIALALLGLALVAQIWKGATLNGWGVIWALIDALALAVYFLVGEKLLVNRQPRALTVLGLGVAALLWTITEPLWNFPTEIFTKAIELQGNLAGKHLPGWVLILWIIVMGTIVPYLLVLSGLKELSASTSSVIGMSEPVFAGIFAFAWLQESFNLIQLLGAVVVLTGIYYADKARIAAH